MTTPLTKRDEIRAASEAMRPRKAEVPLWNSLIIARLLGPLLATIGVGMVINTETYRQIGQQFLTTYAIIYVSGIIILVMGLTILNFHYRWTPDWRSVITAIGFVFTAAGMWRIIAPQFVPFVGGAILANQNFFFGCGIVLITIGGLLTYKGYVASHETEPQRTRVQGDLT